MEYFSFNKEKIFVDYKDGKLLFMKYINDKLIILTEEETNIILNSLRTNNEHVFNSQELVDLMHSNSSLNSNFNYYYNLFSCVESIIPSKYKSNFYNNLKTLQVDLNLDVIYNEEEKSFYTDSAGYNTKNNKITISPRYIKETKEVSEKTSNKEEFFWREYNHTLLHELFHVASSNYDKNTGITLGGFCKYPLNDAKFTNRGLTEGMTEVLACCGIPGTIEIACGYYIEELFVDQLSQIIGPEPLIESYFGNLGNELLCEKLKEIDGSGINDYYLFNLIELNYSLKEENDKQTILGGIQEKLVLYFSKKILKDIENGLSEKEIRNKIIMYKNYLVTKDVLITMQKNPDNYPNLNDSLDEFKNLEELVDNLFKDRTR